MRIARHVSEYTYICNGHGSAMGDARSFSGRAYMARVISKKIASASPRAYMSYKVKRGVFFHLERKDWF